MDNPRSIASITGAPDGAPGDDADVALARDVLFPVKRPTGPFAVDAGVTAPPCDEGDGASQVRCLLAARYAGDDAARDLALRLFADTGDVAGVDREQTMDGGYRGMLHLVPALPVGAARVHLERVAAALHDYDAFFAALAGRGARPVAYRWKPLSLRFFRSVKARTPSAYAERWSVSYNVDGSLNGDADSVRETMFHEVFHLNDAAHDDWSARALAADYAAVVSRCQVSVACLAPYAPSSTKVRGGTYYAFQPGNGVREYAAELALRYYREQRGALGQGPRVAPFKCARAENGRTWAALVAEFFGGIDLVPACRP